MIYQWLPKLLKKPNPTIFEIGCSDGTDTRQMLELFPDARIYCFEPEPRAIARFDANAVLIPSAVGAVDGEIDFYPSHGDGIVKQVDWDCSGSIRRPTGHLRLYPWCGFGEPRRVRSLTLDSWAVNIPLIDFIWADVQGAEGDVIRGGLATFQRTRYFYTEYSDEELYEGQITLDRMIELLPRWTIVERWSDDVLLRNTDLTESIGQRP
jgi:FkbM family methyltransferase